MADELHTPLERLTFARVAALPSAAQSRGLAGAAIDQDGQLLLSLSAAGEGAPQDTLEGGSRVIRWQDGAWRETWAVNASTGSFVHPAPDGGLLVVDPHSRRHPSGAAELNATVYDAAGNVRVRFVAGDGVVDVQADDSHIWVAYGDLGTTGDFGLFGWGRLSPDEWVEPVGSHGLVAFDWLGRLVRSVEPVRPIIDCFALNVSMDGVWCSHFPGFELLCVAADGTMRSWAGLGVPVTAVAIAPGAVLVGRLVVGEPIRVWRGQLGERALAGIRELQPALAGEPIEAVRYLLARGGLLHAVTDEAWYRVDAR